MEGPHTLAAEVNSGSTAGLQKLTGGPSPSAMIGDVVRALDQHVLAARRDIDVARHDRFAVDRLAGGPAAGTREMLGQNGGEGRRHVLGDQHGGAVDDAGELRRPPRSGPAARRSRSRSAAPAARTLPNGRSLIAPADGSSVFAGAP